MRVLTTVEVAVAAADEAAYLATVQLLAGRLRARGQQLWLFRSHEGDGRFLECTEGKDPATHRMTGPADAREAELEARLRTLGRYDARTTTRWDDVPFADS